MSWIKRVFLWFSRNQLSGDGERAAASDLNAIWSDLKHRYDDAVDRGDDRDTGRLSMSLRQAQTDRLRAELGR